MSAPQTPTTSRDSECAALASLLALRDTGMLDATESARVDRHLTTCAACQADAALDDALASHLRRALIAPPNTAPTLSMREIMRASDTAAPRSMRGAGSALVEAAERRIPHAYPISHRWGTGLSALLAAVVVIVFAASMFGSLGSRLSGNRRGVTPALTVSPLLAHQTVYVPTETGIYALRASDGALRWAYLPTKIKTSLNHTPIIRGLTLDGDMLYALATTSNNFPHPDSALLALDARTGAVRWRVAIPDLGWASLLRVGNLLIVTPAMTAGLYEMGSPFNQTLLAYSATNGQRLWSRKLTEPPLSASVTANGALYTATSTQLIALDAASGALRWTTPIVPSASQQGTMPASYNSSVALAAAGPYVFVLTKRDIWSGRTDSWEANVYEIAAADGTHIVRNGFEQEPQSAAFPPALGGNQLFAPVFGGLSAFSTGASPKLQWRFIPTGAPDGGMAMTGGAYVSGVVYVTGVFTVLDNNVEYQRNYTYAVRASDGAQLWRSQIYGDVGALTPVVASGMVFTPAGGTLLALRAADGQRLWKYPSPGGSVIYGVLIGS